MNIILVGFMGTGKTVVGKELAKILKTRFIDVDDLIEQKEGRKISRIFEEDGEEYFRNCEYKMIKRISRLDNCVISPGGGAVLEFENVLNLKKNGIIVCLTALPDVIWKRVKKNKNRPLLKVKNPLKRIKTLLKFRESYYKQADIFVDTSKLSVEEVGMKILEEIIGTDYADRKRLY
ncbi:MAG: hypothetical protein B5M48_01145 [Candidatus Omnitrophica bacterium 4484_213]|nr:MAG: hypothetical protein B5M48_01145 [Candidatus Omnitrophica bacterium 4484_213]